jgi:hypothetical protein
MFNRSTARRAGRSFSRTCAFVTESLEARRLLAAVNWTGLGDGVNWTSAANWSNNAVPTSADDVTINIAANPNVTVSGVQSVRSIVSAERMTFNSATLTIAQPSSFSDLVTLNSSTFNGAGNVNVTGTLTLNNGTLSGTGSATIANGATLNLVSSSSVLGNTLTNNGTTNFTGGSLSFVNGTFINNGSFVADSNTTIQLLGGSANPVPVNLFTNNGSFTKRGTGTLNIAFSSSALPFNNAGTVTIESGILDLSSSSTHTGNFNVLAGAELELRSNATATGHSFGPASQLNGAGTYEFSTGTHTIARNQTNTATFNFIGGSTSSTTFAGTLSAGAANITGGNPITFNGTTTLGGGSLTSGQMLGSGNVTINGPFTQSTGTMAGTGTTTLANGTTLNHASGTLTLSRTFVNNGTYNFTGSGNLTFTNGTFNNVGAFVADSASTLQMFGGFSNPAAVNVFNNSGTLTKRGTGLFQSFLSNSIVPVNNSGSVVVEAGTLELRSTGSHTGSFTVASGARIDFGSNVAATGHTFSPASTLTGTGTFEFSTGTHTYPGSISNAAALLFSGGSTSNATIGGNVSTNSINFTNGSVATFNGTAVTAVNATFTNGTFTGPANLTLSGLVNIGTGAMTGTGTATLANTAQLNLTSGTFTVGRVVTQNGSTLHTAGSIAFAAGRFINNGSYVAQSDTTLQFFGNTSNPPTANEFVNNGTFTKRGTGTTQFIVSSSIAPMINAGNVVIEEGTLNLDTPASHTGDFAIASGAIMVVGSNAAATGNTFAVGSDITGSGTLRFTTGTHTYNGALNNTAQINVISGTTTINGTVNVAELLMSSGTINFNAATTTPVVTVTNGTIGGSGLFTVSGLAVFSNVTLAGSGTLRSTVGGQLRFINGSNVISRTIDNDGQTTWTGGSLNFINGTFVNDGAFTIDSDQGNSLQAFGGFASPTPVNAFNNNGTLVKTGLSRASFFTSSSTLPFNNTGSIQVAEGELAILAGGSQTGSASIAAGTSLELSGGISQSAAGSVTGTGTLRLPSGNPNAVNTYHGTLNVTNLVSDASTHAFNGTSTFADATFSGNSILEGSGLVTVTNRLIWAGGTMRGTGITRVASTGELRLTTTTHTLSRTLESNGSARWTGGGITFTNGTLVNNGTFTANSDIALSAIGGFDTPTPVNLFVNNGSFVKQGLGEADFRLSSSTVPFNNLGSVNVQTGILTFAAGGASTGGFATQAGATLQLGGAHTVSAAGSFTGAGTTRLITGSAPNTSTINAPINVGNFEISGGTFDVNAEINASTGRFTGGTLQGSGNFRFNQSLIWNTGTVAGAGNLLIPVGSTLQVRDGNQGLQRTLNINGSSLFRGMSMNLINGTISNAGTLTFDGDNTNQLFGGFLSPTPVNAFNNSGTIIKLGSGTAQMITSSSTVPFNNSGLVRVERGTFNVSTSNIGAGTFLSSGQYRVSDGASFTHGSQITTLTADIEIAGTGSVPQLTGLLINRGRIALTGSADFTLPAATNRVYTQEGILELGVDSVFTVNGNMVFAGTSQPVVQNDLGSLTSFGRLVVTGSVNLNSPNSASRFDPDLVNGYDPALGSRHDVIVAAGGITNAFDSFQGGATPSNNILLATRPDANTVAVEVGPGPLPPGPQILSQTFEFETREAVTLTFNQNVSAFLGRKDFQLVNLTTGLPVDQSVGSLIYNPTSNVASLLLTGLLPDADYRVTVNASDVSNGAGVPASGAPIIINFHILKGDANRDRATNFADLLILSQNFGQSGRTYSLGNFDYSSDGLVEFADLLILSQNFGTQLLSSNPMPSTSTRNLKRVAESVLR